MTKKRKPKPAPAPEKDWIDTTWLGTELPVVGELKDCRQLSKDHWQAIDSANGNIVDIRGGAIPRRLRLLAIVEGQIVGFIRLIPAAA